MLKSNRKFKQLPAGAVLAAVSLASLLAYVSSASSEPMNETRQPGTKLSLAQMLGLPHSNRVIMKFREGRRVRLSRDRFTGMTGGEAAAFSRVLSSLGVSQNTIRRLHAQSEVDLDRERDAAQAATRRELADLNLYYVIDLPPGVNAAILADRLNALPIVEFAEPGPVPAPPPTDIPPTSPDLRGSQGYKLSPPQGIGTPKTRAYPGSNGKGIKIVDIEYSWQLDHEDVELPSSRILTSGATLSDPFSSTNHGTAVLGEIVGRKNPYGVTGIVPTAKAWVAPANTSEFGYDPARAIGIATGLLKKGDVIIIEQQFSVCNSSSFGPLEWVQSVFDAVSAATAKGIVVVAAAGNGAVDLDGVSCAGKFDTTVRNSHAIIVGAGTSTDHSRLSFSSFGSRVDVQGWGQNVTTAGYGGAFDPGDIRQRYTLTFSGTSSATPIVAGSVVSIQGVLKACGLPPLTPDEMRNALVSTGTPQGTSLGGHIGPLPDIKEALDTTDAAGCLSSLATRRGF
jgi:serine protease